jgi:hypothetical protein
MRRRPQFSGPTLSDPCGPYTERVFTLFRRGPQGADAPRLKPRSEAKRAAVERVSLEEFTPAVLAYLGQVAYHQLAMFELLSRAVGTAPDIAGKEAVSTAAGIALNRHQALAAEIKRHGNDPATVMKPVAPAIDRFCRLVAGADWYETLVSTIITGGLLDDFYVRLAAGLPAEYRERVIIILSSGDERGGLVEAVKRGIATQPALGSRLAMWGRRLVGDTFLVARSAMLAAADPSSAEARLEPVFTELIAAHTRRMDAMGLTA